MRRRQKADRDAPSTVVEQPADEHDGFWTGDDLVEHGPAHALAAVAEDHSLEYGRRAMPDTTELAAMAELNMLANWAEDQACRACRSRMEETHDPAALEHDECRIALRVARLLSRYPDVAG
jgi:hypothetical protein